MLINQQEDEKEEVWKDIPGFEEYYQASSLGRIRSLTRTISTPRFSRRHYEGQLIALTFNTGSGYLMVGLRKAGVNSNNLVHVLVARTFMGLPPKGMTVNHNDGNKLNNRPDNLTYLTQSDNNKHAFSTGLANNNKRTDRCALTDDQVKEVRRLHSDGLSMGKIAKQFLVSKGNIQHIVERKRYKWVQE